MSHNQPSSPNSDGSAGPPMPSVTILPPPVRPIRPNTGSYVYNLKLKAARMALMQDSKEDDEERSSSPDDATVLERYGARGRRNAILSMNEIMTETDALDAPTHDAMNAIPVSLAANTNALPPTALAVSSSLKRASQDATEGSSQHKKQVAKSAIQMLANSATPVLNYPYPHPFVYNVPFMPDASPKLFAPNDNAKSSSSHYPPHNDKH